MSDELIQLSPEQTELAQKLLRSHIDALNEQYARAMEALTKDMAEDAKRWETFSKRSTWIVWALFWISGFLARGLFQGPMEWQLASFATGISTGVLVYWSVYGAIHVLMFKRRKS